MPTLQIVDSNPRRAVAVLLALVVVGSAIAAVVDNDTVLTLLGLVVGASAVLCLSVLALMWWARSNRRGAAPVSGTAGPTSAASSTATSSLPSTGSTAGNPAGTTDQDSLDALEPLRAARRNPQ